MSGHRYQFPHIQGLLNDMQTECRHSKWDKMLQRIETCIPEQPPECWHTKLEYSSNQNWRKLNFAVALRKKVALDLRNMSWNFYLQLECHYTTQASHLLHLRTLV